MRRFSRKLRHLSSNLLDLPKDVIFDLPRVTMIGNMQMYIENHRGVLRFDSEQLRLRLSVGQFIIKGKELTIRAILPEEVLIEGIVVDIRYLTE